MASTFKGIVRDLSGRGGVVTRGRAIEESDGSNSPVKQSEKVSEVATEKVE